LARKGVNKQQIVKVAQEITATGDLSTANKIKSLLTIGSIATIQKHLQAYKKHCFKLYLQVNLLEKLVMEIYGCLCRSIYTASQINSKLKNILINFVEKIKQNVQLRKTRWFLLKASMEIFIRLCNSTIGIIIQNFKWRLIGRALDFRIYEMLLANWIQVKRHQKFLIPNIFYYLTVIKIPSFYLNFYLLI